MSILASWLLNSISPDDLRFYFLILFVLAIAIYKIAHIAWRRGRRSVLREHFSFTLTRDHSVRRRL